jgi:hypothetical protein
MSQPTTSLRFNATTPAAPSGQQNVKFQSDGGSIQQQITAYDPIMVGDSGSGGTGGNVPAPGAGDAAAGKFLSAAGDWEVPSGGGGSSPITTEGDIIVGGSGGTPQRLAAGTAGEFLQTGGPGALPAWVPGGGGSWSSLTDPTANLSLAMGSDTSTFTYGATTGSNDLFILVDTLNNTGTGALLSVQQANGTSALGIRAKLLHDTVSQPQIQCENTTAAVMLQISTCDISGTGTIQFNTVGGPIRFMRGGTLGSASNTMLEFTDSTTSKWLAILSSNFDGLTSSEVGFTVTNQQTMSTSSTASILSVQNNGTRVFDVTPGEVNVKVGFGVPISTKTSAYSATNQDHTILANGTFTVTLSGSGLMVGHLYTVKNIGTGTITVSASAGIDGGTSQALSTQYQTLKVQWDGTQFWVV